MTPFAHVRFAAKSDVGRRRKNNEDAFGVFPQCGVFCVADGMGGGDDGEIASNATVDGVRRFCEGHPFPEGKCWRMDDWLQGVASSVAGASAWIHGRARSLGLAGCGSTFVGLCLDPSHPAKAVALHAGDSRLYLLRGRGIRQVTKDHSAAEMIGVKNEKDMNPRFRGMILRAVGIMPAVELERTVFDVKPGDRVLLCSDGLSKMLPDNKISALAHASGSLSDVVDSLVAAANEAGGVDNVTVVLVEFGFLPNALPAMPIPPGPVREANADGALEWDSDTAEESDTRDTGSTLATMVPESAGAGAGASAPMHTRKRRRLPLRFWVALAVAFVLAALGGLCGWMVWRRVSASNAAEEVRRAEMSAAVKAVARQTSEKDRRRAREAAALRAEDAEKAQREREDERREFRGNVDLPVE